MITNNIKLRMHAVQLMVSEGTYLKTEAMLIKYSNDGIVRRTNELIVHYLAVRRISCYM